MKILGGHKRYIAIQNKAGSGAAYKPLKARHNRYMKSVIFARVSSREQEETGYSLPSQEKLLKEYGERKDFSISKKFSISESAGGKYQRKTFNEMLEYVKENNINIIICEKVDRLTRNLRDAVSINEWINEDSKRQVHFVKENCILSRDSKSNEKFIWNIKVSVAQYYIDNLSEEVRKGQKEKLAQGWLPTKPPLGYKTIGDKGHKTHVIDWDVAPYIRKMFEYYSSGNHSLKSLVEVMHQEGMRNREGKKICRSRIHLLVSNPFYYGKIMWKGELHRGEHEPIISKELFDLVQDRLFRKIKNPQYKKHLTVFKAKIDCSECGGTITWESQRGHWYGHCNHHKACSQKKYIRQEKVEDQLFPFFDRMAPENERVRAWIVTALKEAHADEISYSTTSREELNRNFERIQRRLEAIYEDKIDGKITGEFYARKFQEYTEQKEEILNTLNRLNKANTKYYEAGYAIHELACKAADIYSSTKASIEDKRLLLSYIFSNISLNSSKIKPNYTLAFDFLFQHVPGLNKNFERLENKANKGQRDVFTSLCPALLHVVVLNQFYQAFQGVSSRLNLDTVRSVILWEIRHLGGSSKSCLPVTSGSRMLHDVTLFWSCQNIRNDKIMALNQDKI